MMIIETPDYIPSMPCEYKGINYRSRLEARWAEWLDRQGILFKYEEKTFDMDGLWYCPDFHLPEYHIWLEVKGVMDELSLKKITEFSSHARFSRQLFVGFSEIGTVLNATRAFYEDYHPKEYGFKQLKLLRIIEKIKAKKKVDKIVKRTGNYDLAYQVGLFIKYGIFFDNELN